MSAPPSPPLRNKPRKKRPVDVVSFEDLLAAHTTERQPGQLPPEGVVLIGVDVELQRRMAERIAPPDSGAPNNDALSLSSSSLPETSTNIGAPKIDIDIAPSQNFTAPESGA